MAIAMSMAMLYMPAQAWAQQAETSDASSTGTVQKAKPETPAEKAGAKPGKKQDATDLTAVTVTGVRASMASAISIKQGADQIVDSIVAEDIGKLPDNNVAEALQRISGVQIDRNYGEGSSIAIRGLTQVRTELNGGDSFTANGGDTLSFEDVPSELLAGIDVYKNPSAEMIEGGLGGTVDLRTHMPFDFTGQKFAVSSEYDYADLAKKGKPSASVLYSNRWKTSAGEFGILVDLAYQKHAFRQDVISTEPFYAVQAGSGGAYANYPNYTGQTLEVPHGGGVGETVGERRRMGSDVALQWRPNSDVELHAQAVRSDYHFQWNDYSYFAYTGTTPIVLDTTKPYSFGPSGNFLSGTFDATGSLDTEGNPDPNGATTAGIPVASNSSLTTRHSITTDYTWGASWNVTNNLSLKTDFQFIDASTTTFRYILNTSTTTPYLYQDISGGLPVLKVDTAYTTNPANNTFGYLLDDKTNATGREFAWRADGEYTLGGNFFQSIKFGVRTTDRTAETEDSGYRFVYIGQPLSNFPASSWVIKTYSDFFHGNANTFGSTITPNPALLFDYVNSLAMFGETTPLSYPATGINNQGQKTYGGYGLVTFGSQLGSIPYDGNVGLRAVRTNVSSNGALLNSLGETLPLDVNNSYNSFLPSLNVTFHLTDKLQWRFAASKGLSRPTFDQLNPMLQLSTPDATTGVNAYTGTAGGNPYLKPMTANQFDTSLEWYLSPSQLLSGALFYKSVNGFVQTVTLEKPEIDQFGVVHDYAISSLENGKNGVIKGAEVGYQTFFDFLPAPFNGLGMQANYTYVYSKAPSPDAYDTSGNPLLVPLEGLSKNSYNLILMYEKGPVSARIAYNWRSQWVETTQGNGTGSLPIYDKAFGQVDASVTYHVTKDFSLTAAAVNLTNTKRGTNFGLDTLPRDVQINDRMFSLKAQLDF
ncbi:TonB-dependent receptor [Rhodanobacter sp. MP1X3]|uniref:TonB-dependent receptor n=1 Tax=Rhodanobacter sp. MP1X3 TaxID=2723086 RepID=UPI0018590C30|nr:TonB-dependent receptor [Rhodanobacter sp. MP1X3]MBB6242498.1 TonB-dependent receptor [Rhodanobacter sp. MP1X3]